MVAKEKKDLPEAADDGFVEKPLTSSDSDKKSKKSKKKEAAKEVKSKKHHDSDENSIDEHLSQIYENPDGSLPDMSHFEKRKRIRVVTAFFTLLFACIFLGAVAWLGFFVLGPQSGFSEKDVILSISGNEDVIIGEEVRYRLRYRNDQNVNLRDVKVQVRYPEGFVLSDTSLDPNNEAKDEWELGGLAPQESGFIDIFGSLYGSLNEEQSFRVFFSYTPDNFSSPFQKVAHTVTKFASAPATINVQGPEEIVSGGSVAFSVRAKGLEDSDLKNIAIDIAPNDNFVLRDSSPDSDQFQDEQWSFVDLSEERLVNLVGVFTGDRFDEEGKVTVRLVGWKDDDRTKEPYVYATTDYMVKFLQTDVSANLVVNGATDSLTVEPGETLNTSVVVKNAGNTAIKNVSARIVFDAPSADRKSILDWIELEDAADGDIRGDQLNNDRRRGAITWNSRHVRDFRDLAGLADIILDFSLPIKDAEDTDLTEFPNGTIEAILEVEYELNGKEEKITTQPIVMTINSDTDLEVRETVDEEERTIQLVLTNSFHELENVIVELDIFGDISWREDLLSVPAGELDFDASDKKVRWVVEKMPTAVDVLALQFGVDLNSVNPTQTHLTSKVSMKAKDTITGLEILKIKDGVVLDGE